MQRRHSVVESGALQGRPALHNIPIVGGVETTNDRQLILDDMGLPVSAIDDQGSTDSTAMEHGVA